LVNRLQPIGYHTICLPGGSGSFVYKADPDDRLARDLVWTGFGRWESTTVPIVYQFAQHSRGFLDIGAYTGIYTLLACASNSALEVAAFEPQPDVFRMLEANVRANPGFSHRVTLVPKAVSDKPGDALLSVPHDPTAASIVPGREGTSRLVRTVRGDDAVPPGLEVDLIKIDVEGHELAVLSGLERTLETHPVLIVECLSGAFSPVRDVLRRSGYRVFEYLGPTGPVDASGVVHQVPCYPNFLCRGGS
jgi:FkbM family methyltransferase